MIDAELTPSLIVGGPFWRLQQRLGLLAPDHLPRLSTALILAAVAWLPPALLSMAEGVPWSEVLGSRAFLLDFGAYARFIVAVVMLVVVERIADERGAALIRQFTDAGLVAPEELPRFTAALQRADRRTSSVLAEVIILVIAYAASASGLIIQVIELQESWVGSVANEHVRFSMAGWWTLLFSLPLFWFLVLRWLWRFVVLTRMFWDVAGLKLRLVATHPDQSAGIGFMGLYPSMFAGLVFALSCVTAATGLQVVLFAGWSLKSLVAPFLMWTVLVLVIFAGPLAVFAPALMKLKRRALLLYSALACEKNRALERKWLQRGDFGEDILGTTDASSLADLTTAVQSISAMRVIPIGAMALLPLLIATGLPWVAVVATQVPFLELLTMVAQALL